MSDVAADDEAVVAAVVVAAVENTSEEEDPLLLLRECGADGESRANYSDVTSTGERERKKSKSEKGERENVSVCQYALKRPILRIVKVCHGNISLSLAPAKKITPGALRSFNIIVGPLFLHRDIASPFLFPPSLAQIQDPPSPLLLQISHFGASSSP